MCARASALGTQSAISKSGPVAPRLLEALALKPSSPGIPPAGVSRLLPGNVYLGGLFLAPNAGASSQLLLQLGPILDQDHHTQS